MVTPSHNTKTINRKCTHYDFHNIFSYKIPNLVCIPSLFHQPNFLSFIHSFILSYSYSLSYFSIPYSLSPMAKDLKELQESDVIFPDHHHVHHHNNNNTCFDYQEMNHHNSRESRNSNFSKDYNKRMANSLPVNIPGSIFHHGNNNSFEDDEREGEEMVPPHVITGRRVEGKMAFSVCTGNGRTLKGRDLSKVRNSILRMTGFLET